MFSPYKNSYLQLVCAINPRVINKAVDQAMQRKHFDPHTELPPAQRLESMQPSLYAPLVDITRARVGFGRIGLRVLIRQLHDTDDLVQLQALHSVLDQVQITENAMFLINLHIVYRIMDLIANRNPVIREKVCMILTHLANYYQGRMQIMNRPQIIEDLMWLFMRDRKEIRYAAAHTLKTLAVDRCACEVIVQIPNIIENLLKSIVNEHTGIVLLHLETLENLIEWDQVVPLKENAFQIMLTLFNNDDPRIVSRAMDCMTQLCKHKIGQLLADNYDLTHLLRLHLNRKPDQDIELMVSAVGLMAYTTLTTRSKWRAKEFCTDLTQRLVKLCHTPNMPRLQYRCMQILINLCDCPDIRYHMKTHWEDTISKIKIRTHEQWDGTSESTSYGLETGHNYRTMCIEGVSTIKNDYGDNASVINVHSYLKTIRDMRERLIKAINWKSYRD